ncbi:MAG: 50S ribosomal protein L3 N(5)-glutamine methyltransferase [Alphaproteobacteria bacterium]|nr:50S ribosomal protein L3 N(5)-glutamine methyltransferase [Alphaproteobacteria bacterium]
MAQRIKPPAPTLGRFFDDTVKRLARARLAYGHGTTNARDEAAFLVLEGLGLPIDRLDPYRDLQLSEGEQRKLTTLVQRRIEERIPAPYLLGAAYMQGVRFQSDPRALIPRSFIGDMLAGGMLPFAEDARANRILDLCTGSGCLAILAAFAFPRARIDAVDLSAPALALAGQNVATHRLRERIELLRGDLFAPLKGRRYDLIISNPPYVDADGMADLPPEFLHEPRMALAAGDNGLDLVHRILAEAPKYLTPKGALLCEVGRGKANIEAAYPRTPFLWLDTELSEGEVFWLDARNLPGKSPAPAP